VDKVNKYFIWLYKSVKIIYWLNFYEIVFPPLTFVNRKAKTHET